MKCNTRSIGGGPRDLELWSSNEHVSSADIPLQTSTPYQREDLEPRRIESATAPLHGVFISTRYLFVPMTTRLLWLL
ncbi:hypothetical protein TNCV_4554481 [Trichonephila clavipes]|nr:hypothetical protein TNCV_4554481 [Trichonephila clavipes]